MHQKSADVKLGLLEEFAEVFRDKLGVSKDIEATVTVHESATPRFHKARLVPFALKENVEKQLQQHVQEASSCQWTVVTRQPQLWWCTRRMGDQDLR